MLRSSISRNTKNVNKEEILVSQKELPFVILPKAVFLLKRNPETQRYSLFRLIVLLGYLYSLAMTKEKTAKTSYSELKKILNLKSKSTLQELFKFLEREGIVSERVFHFKTSQKTEIILINSMEIPYVAQSWSEEKVREDLVFKVPKLLYLLPISPFSKAVYMYLCSLRQYASQSTIRTTTRKIRESLRMKKKNIILALNELENHYIIKTTRTRKETCIEILPTDNWSSKLLTEARELYPDHPLLFTGTNREPSRTNKEPQGTNKEPPGTNREPPRTNKEPLQDPKDLSTNDKVEVVEDYIKDKEIEDYIEDDAIYNNGGGEKRNILNSFNSKEKIREETSNSCKASTLVDKNNAPSYTRPNGLKNKKKAGELGKPNNRAAKLEERIDQQELEKIKKALSRIADAVQNLLSYYRVELKEELYNPLRDIYGKEWKTIAGMYELFDRKEPKFGYSRKANTNYLGLLISFALKDSQASFWDFYDRFKRIFGVKETLKDRNKNTNKSLLELLGKLKQALKSYLSSKPTTYKYVVEEGILGIEERDNGLKVLKCKEFAICEYIRKLLKDHVSRVLGEYGRDWIVEC